MLPSPSCAARRRASNHGCHAIVAAILVNVEVKEADADDAGGVVVEWVLRALGGVGGWG